jgi:polysaccharide pyruvyl transferase WcaK-like protein
MGTPVVGISYEQKVKSLFGMLQLDEYCHDLFRLDASGLAAGIEKALDSEAAIRTHLEQRVGALREQVLASAMTALRLPER